MDWNMLIVLLGGMLLGAGGMGLFLRRRPSREQQYARDMAMLADRLEQLPADGEHPFVTMPCQGDTARVAAGIEKLADELSATRQRVEKERRKAYYILDNMDSGLLLVDGSFVIRQCNASAYKYLTGCEELVGAPLSEACDDEGLRKAVRNAITNEVSTVLDLDLTARTGTIVSARVTPAVGSLFDAENQISAVIVLTNVTQSRQMEAQRREFIANISHELKTPITSILGFTELMTSGVVTDPIQKAQYLERIGEEGRRMSNLIDDILRLSSLESKQAEEVWERVDLRCLCEDIFRSLEPIMKKRGITGEIFGAAHYYAYPDDMRQLLKNLMENAVKYNRENGRVTVRISPDAYQCVISVVDTGIGIPLEHQSRVFERFYRVDKGRSKREGGTGLGLSIVKHITAKYAGQITLVSRPDEGTSIRVTLPVTEEGRR